MSGRRAMRELDDLPDGKTAPTTGYDLAVEFLRRCLVVSKPVESHLRKAYALLVNSLLQSGRADEAWKSCQEGLGLYPDDKELLFRCAMLHHHFGRLADAAYFYLRVLNDPEERHFTSVDMGLAGHKARHNLAMVYDDMGRHADAENEWLRIVNEVPDYHLGWRKLGENLLRQQKAAQAERVAAHLKAQGGLLHCEGHILHGRIAAARGELTTAVRELEFADRSRPQDLEALKLTCRILYEQGAPAEAANALRELTERSPGNASALHNLGTMQFAQQRYDEAAASFERSLTLRPNAHATRTQLSRALNRLGRGRGLQPAPSIVNKV